MTERLTGIQKFKEYLDAIGIKDPIRERIDAIFGLIKEIYNFSEIDDIIVTDYIKEDESRVFEHIDFYSKNMFCFVSAMNFMTDIDLRIGQCNKNVVFIKAQAKDYDFKKATEASRLNVFCLFDNHLEAHFKAAKENCDYLREIVRKYYIANLKE